MASTGLPYRVCLGDYRGDHSLVVHSARGIEWHNIHPDLEKILNQSNTRDILDLAIGNHGFYYIAYREGAYVRQVVTPQIWSEIISGKTSFRGRISKVAFGNGGEFWAVIEENGVLEVVSGIRPGTRPRLLGVFNPKKGRPVVAQDVGFLALGKASKNFVVKIGTDVVLGGHGGIRGSKSSRKVHSNADIIRHFTRFGIYCYKAATLSPLDNAHFFVTFKDGSYRDGLPQRLRGIVLPHLDPAASLLRMPIPILPTQMHQLTSKASTDFVPTLASPSWSHSPSTELILLDCRHADYIRIQGLFYDGWKHPLKPRPDLRYIYEVKMPGRLITGYLSYRLEILRALGSPVGLERELFHGTSRRCLLGNEPELNRPCEDTSCRLCSILRSSFTTIKAGTANGRTFMRFGRGIYTSSVSSKADDYTAAPDVTGYRAILVARVVLGNAYSLKLTSQNIAGPPSGYHSVFGEVGMHLNYDEHVVYSDEAARPAYLVIYRP